MQAIKLTKPYDVRLVELDKPTPGHGEALIRIVTAGICGSDIGAYRGTNALVQYPVILGHELAGIIETLPEDYSGDLKPGDGVVLNPYLHCGQCYPCSLGRTNCCENLRVRGVHIDGGMAEYVTHPADMIVAVPPGMTREEAAMAEPLTISLHGIHRGELKAGEHCVIIGAGPIGLLAALAAKAYDAVPIVIDILPERLEFARSIGIDEVINPNLEDAVQRIEKITNGRMAELVMECSGANGAIRSTLDYVAFAGRITLTGWPKDETSLPTDIITKKELDIRGARTSVGEFEEALELIHSKRVDVMAIHTMTIGIKEAPAVIRDIMANPQDYLKVIVEIPT